MDRHDQLTAIININARHKTCKSEIMEGQLGRKWKVAPLKKYDLSMKSASL